MTLPVCKVFCLTKNEFDLIEDFILYYGCLVGYDNIVLIDNGSTDHHVNMVYTKYQSLGVEIIVDKRPMSVQADIMTDIMRMYIDKCMFMLPLDTDEFVYSVHGRLTRKDLERMLTDLPDFFTGIFYNTIMECVPSTGCPHPARELNKFVRAYTTKVIVRASAFMWVVPGNHEARTTDGFRTISTDLGILHYHHTDKDRRLQRAVQFLQSAGHLHDHEIGDKDTLIQTCKTRITTQNQLLCGHIYREIVNILEASDQGNNDKEAVVINSVADVLKGL